MPIGFSRRAFWVAVVVLNVGTGLAAAQTYTFENLNPGALNGQDNWSATHTNVAAGSGTDLSKIAAVDMITGFAAQGTRVNNANFSFPHIVGNEINLVLQFDVRYAVPETTEDQAALFALGHNGPSSGTFFDFGPSFGYNALGFEIYPLASSGSGNSYAFPPASFSPGEWIRLQLRMNLTANGGDGAGSLFYKNLTDGEAAFTQFQLRVPEDGYTNNHSTTNLHLSQMAAGSGPSTWDTMWFLMYGGPTTTGFDNLQVTVPEPASIVLAALGCLCLGARIFRNRLRARR